MKKLLLITAMLSTFNIAYAKPDIQQLEKTLKIEKILNVEQTPVKGLYEVSTEEKMFYTNEKGNIVIIGGEMFDIEKNENLSSKTAKKLISNMEQKVEKQFQGYISTFKESAIIEKLGDGSRELFVFTNPDCPYCKKQEPELKKLTNVTIYRIMIPSTQEAYLKSTKIWCSTDKQQAWDNVMAGQKIESDACDNPIKKNIETSNKLRISGTPTILDNKGHRLVGLKSIDKIEVFMNGANK